MERTITLTPAEDKDLADLAKIAGRHWKRMGFARDPCQRGINRSWLIRELVRRELARLEQGGA